MESELYEGWVNAGYFKADASSSKPAYSIVLPPPNVTGSLHMGHALDHTLMDALTRRKRMQGYEVLWLPGMDHAGIATQTVVEKQLAVDGKTKEDFGRELFIDKVWDWKHDSGGTIGGQMRRLGDGVDWSRDRFTMDDGLSRAVRTIFKRLYDAGLIYQAERLVNWSPVLETAISDLEVKYEDVEGELVSFRYGSLRRRRTAHRGGHHPGGDDARRHRDRGASRRRALPRTWSARRCRTRSSTAQIVIVADEHVDPEFGTGAVKVTPAHDPNDFEIGMRHQLPMPSIMDTQGPDRRHRNRIRRPGPLRGPRQGARSAGRAGPHRRGEAAVPAQRRAFRAQRRADRAAAVAAVVGQGRVAGQGRRRRGSQRRHRDSPAEPGAALVRLGRQHARLVHLAPAVVGPPHPDLARPRRRHRLRGTGRDPARGLGAGPRRAGHLVLVGAVAVLHHGLARPHARTGEVLSDKRSGHRLRHPVLLGGPDDDVRHVRRRRSRHHARRAARAAGAVRERLSARPDPRRVRPQDEQVARQQHRPAGLGGGVRRRRAAVHAGPRRQPRRRPVDRRGPRSRVAQLRHQAVQRHPVRADERRRPGPAARAPRTHRRRPMDPGPVGRGSRRGGFGVRQLRVQPGMRVALPLRLGRVLRLVRRAGQGAVGRRCRSTPRRCWPRCWTRCSSCCTR